jgi:hypothetical protein
MINQQADEMKKDFLNKYLLSNSIKAALQRNQLYDNHSQKERNDIRLHWRNLLTEIGNKMK